VFDGPPQNMASLIPVAIKHGAQWDMTKKGDVYLVCGYKGTRKTITIHAPDTMVCKALDTPGTTAFCD
jgi:hypothetical protein